MIPRVRHITQTLAFRVFVLIAGIQAVVLAAMAFATISIHESHLREHVLVSAIRISDLMVRSTRHSMLRNDKGEVQEILAAVGSEPGIHGLRILNKDGVVIFAADSGERGMRFAKKDEVCATCHPPDRMRDGLAQDGHLYRIHESTGGERILALVTPVLNEPSCSRAPCHAHPPGTTVLGVMDVRMSMAGMDASLAESTRQFTMLAVAAVLMVAFVSGGFLWWFVRRPVRSLLHGMAHVSAGTLDRRLPVRSADELGRLAGAFNAMTEELARARAEITEWSETLEAKVREKTDDLERVHRSMRNVEKMASLGNLAAGVAHEINNPLEGILTFAKLSIRRIQKLGLPREETASLCGDLQLVADEASRCGSIVKNMLLFARPQPASFVPSSAGVILDRCRMLVQHYAASHEVAIVIETDPDDALVCDPAQIQQAVMVLMINGIEASAQAPPRAEQRALTVNAGPDAGRRSVRIRVRDEGVGMEEAVRQRIFEPFFTTKTDGRGVGLGLAIAYGIIERHQGSIDVESVPGEGSTFTVTLPREQPVSVAPEPVVHKEEKR